jgi:hypothetical protein
MRNFITYRSNSSNILGLSEQENERDGACSTHGRQAHLKIRHENLKKSTRNT